MSTELPVLLAYAFIASFVLALLKTSRWKIVLISVIVVWCVRFGPTEFNLLIAGKIETYAWFAFLSAAVWLPTLAVSVIGSDLGTRLLKAVFPPQEEEHEEMQEQPAAADEEPDLQS